MNESGKFNFKNHKLLDNEKRKDLLPPDLIMELMGVKEGMTLVDIGAGIGHLLFSALSHIGDTGKIYGLDIHEKMIEILKQKVYERDADNVLIVKCTIEKFPLKDNISNITFSCTVFHEIDDIKKFLVESMRITKNLGKIVVIDWKKKQMLEGPPVNKRHSMSEVKKYLLNLGCNKVETIDLNDKIYMVIGSVIKAN